MSKFRWHAGAQLLRRSRRRCRPVSAQGPQACALAVAIDSENVYTCAPVQPRNNQRLPGVPHQGAAACAEAVLLLLLLLFGVAVLQDKLSALNAAGYLTINSQPPLNGVPSTDAEFGWGGPGG